MSSRDPIQVCGARTVSASNPREPSIMSSVALPDWSAGIIGPITDGSGLIHRCSSSSPSIDNVVRPLTTADTLDRRRRGPAGEDGWDLPVTRQRRPSGRPLATPPRASSANETVKQVPVAIIARCRGSAVLHGRRAHRWEEMDRTECCVPADSDR